MRLKKFTIFSVLCLVNSVIIHSVGAQANITSIESLFENTMKKIKLEMMESLGSNRHEPTASEAVETISARKNKTDQLADSTLKLPATDTNLLASQSDLRKQLLIMNNKLQASQSDLLKHLLNMNKNLLANQSVLQKQLMSKTTNPEPSQTDLLKQLLIMNNDMQSKQLELQKQLLIMKTNSLASQSDLLKQVSSIQNVLLVSQSDHQKQLMSMIKDVKASQLDLQKQLLSIQNNAKAHQSDLEDKLTSTKVEPSCATHIKATGTYYIRPNGTEEKPFLVLCDFEDNFKLGGGWTVFQSRFDGSENFYRNWTMYKNGFGDVNGEHWLGLEKLHLMTRMGRHELLVLLEDFEGNSTYAHYEKFKVGSEAEKYKLTVGKYSGTAGDSFSVHNEMMFSTFDQDNDLAEEENCSVDNKGAWWFEDCHQSHLNGEYQDNSAKAQFARGMIWVTFHGYHTPMKKTKMMLRRRASSKS